MSLLGESIESIGGHGNMSLVSLDFSRPFSFSDFNLYPFSVTVTIGITTVLNSVPFSQPLGPEIAWEPLHNVNVC